MAEEDIIKGLIAEDSKVIRYIYDSNINAAKSILKKNGAIRLDYKDLMQESLITLIENLRKEKFSRESKVSSYFLGILKYKLKNQQRLVSNNKIKYLDELPEYDITEDNDVALNEKELIVIGNQMKTLSVDCQNIIKSFYYGMKSMRMMAKEYGHTEKYMKTKKARCMKRLKNLVISNYQS